MTSKLNVLLCSSCLLLTSALAQASPVLTVGTPGNAMLATPTHPTPNLGGVLINFDSLTPFSNFASSTLSGQGVTISSPDGLIVDPFSTQSGPNELFDNSSNGSANITIALNAGVSAIGIGIADSDPVSITLQALGMGGANLGSPFTVPLSTTESTVNTGNGYYVVADTTNDIFGLRITQSTGNAALFSGLAIDDLQTTPEPSSILFLVAGAAILGFFRLRQRAA
jgi:hypothetical protein